MNEITIRVVEIPGPQGSKTLTRYGAMIEASKKVKPWRNDVKEAALKSYNSGALNFPVKTDIEFVFPRPKSHFGTGKNAEVLKPSAPQYCTSRGNGDIDKLCRSTIDGISVTSGGALIQDDSLIVKLTASKRYCYENELFGAWILVSESED